MPRRTKMRNRKKATTGRPTKYDPLMDDAVYELSKGGANIEDLAEALGVSTTAITDWMRRFDSFQDAVKKGRWKFDSEKVGSALLRRAMGYSFEEVTVEAIVLVEKNGDEELYVAKRTTEGANGKKRNVTKLVPGFKRKVTIKHVMPDVGAICFWLCNREPDEWKNVQRQIVEGKVGHEHRHVLDLSKLSKDELEKLKDIVSKGAREDALADAAGDRQRSGVRQPVPLRLAAVAGR